MEVFAQMKLKQNDFFLKNLEKIKENTGPFRIYFEQLCEILFKIGFDEEAGLTLINSMVEKIEKLNVTERVCLLLYYTLFPLEKIKDQIVKVLSNMPKDKKLDHLNFKATLVVEYLKAAGMDE